MIELLVANASNTHDKGSTTSAPRRTSSTTASECVGAWTSHVSPVTGLDAPATSTGSPVSESHCKSSFD